MNKTKEEFAEKGLYGQSAYDYCLRNQIKLTSFPDAEDDGGLLDLSDPIQRETAKRKMRLDPCLVVCKNPHEDPI